MRLRLSILTVIVCFAAVLRAEQIFYESFEDPVIDGTIDNTPTGWTSAVANKAGLSDAAITGKTGDQFAHIDDYPNNGSHNGALTTTTSIFNTNLVPYVHYTLTCDLTAGATSYEGTMELLANGTVLSNDSETVSTANNFTAKKLQIDYMAYPGNTNLGQTMAIRLRNTAGSWEQKVYFDNLSLNADDTSIDTNAPTPNPMTWVQTPTAAGANSILMTCSTASDTNWVQYLFTNTVNGNNSGWIEVTTWRDTNLTDGVTYDYAVKARDKSTNHNETSWSSTNSATCNSNIVFYDSFEYPIVSSTQSGTDPYQWTDVSTSGNRAGLGNNLSADGYSNYTGKQAVWLNVYNAVPILETTTANLNATLLAQYRYALAFNAAANSTDYTLVADLLAGTNIVLTTQRVGSSQNFAANVASNAFLPQVGDTGVGEALKLRLRVTYSGYPHSQQSYIDNLRLEAVPSTADSTPPTPDPMTWVQKPTPASTNSIIMTCTTASDINYVQYLFTNTVNGNNSGWIEKTTWRDSGLDSGVTYSYVVKARDKSANWNEGTTSTVESATVDGTIIFYDSFESPVTNGLERTADPTDWLDTSPSGNQCGIGNLYGSTYTNYVGHQAAWLNRYNTDPQLETKSTILNHPFVPACGYTLRFNAANSSGYTLVADMMAGTNVVFSAQVSPSNRNFSNNVAQQAFSSDIDDIGLGETLKIRLRTTSGSWDQDSYLDNITLRGVRTNRVWNLAETNITDQSADLIGAMTATNINVYVSAYWGTNNGGTDANAWANTNHLGWYNNLNFTRMTNIISSGLNAGTPYYYAFRGSNTSWTIWDTSSGYFITRTAPIVDNSTGATPVSATSATIRGELTQGGGGAAWICWGDNDARTDSTGDWDNVVYIGSVNQDIPFSTLISGLQTNQTYWYRCYATNAYGVDWSDSGQSFNGTPVAEGGLWTPAELRDLHLWLDAADADTVQLNGGTVSNWVDKSGNGRDVAQANAADQPSYAANTISFDGSSDYLWNSSPFMYTNGEISVFIVAAVNSGTDDRIVAEGWSGGNNPVYCIAETHNSDGSKMCSYFRNDANSAFLNHVALSASGTFNNTMKMYHWRDTGTSIAGRVNGGTETSSGYTRSGTLTLDRFAVGALFRATAAVWVDADINEIVICNNLSDADRENVEGYLAHKWGIEASLPGGHTYETDPPGATVSIGNLAPTNIHIGYASLNAELHAGNTNYTVYIHWGNTDGGTDIDGWDWSAEVGSWTNVSSTNISYFKNGLTGNTTNWYTFRASNDATNVWATPSWLFVTPGRTPIVNSDATNILNTSALLRGTLACPETNYTVYAHWGPTDGTNNAAAWSNSATVGSWSGVDLTNISCSATGLIAGITNYFTFRASNMLENVWARPSGFFVPYDSPVINNSTGATMISATSATLRGELTDGVAASVWICWGDNDGGIDSTGDWDNVVAIGTISEPESFSNNITGLTTNKTYWYRCYASNAAGEDWADSATSFNGTPVSSGVSGYSMQITFTNFAGMGTLTNFPALVKLTTNNTDNYTGFLDTTNGWDLRFWEDGPGSGTELNYEIEKWNMPVEEPTNIAGCVLWLDAGNGAETSGSAVTNWLDLSGNSHHVTQSTNALQPTYVTGVVNGRPVVRFVQTNYLERSDALGFTGNPAMTVFVVTEADDNTPDRFLHLGNGGVASQCVAFATDASFRYNNGNEIFTNHVLNSGFHIGTYVVPAGGNYISPSFYKDGVEATATTNTNPTYTKDLSDNVCRVGAGIGTSGTPGDVLNGDIAEIIVYDSVLSAADLDRVGAYLSGKYNISAYSDTSFVWVKIPELTNNLSIWASWGNSAYNSQETYTTNGDVWTEGFAGVYHAGETTGTRDDSTSNNRNGTPTGNVTNAAGMIAMADEFDGASDELQMPASFGLFNGSVAVSVSFWFNADAVAPGTDYQTSPVLFAGRGEHNWMLTFGDGQPGDTLGVRVQQGTWATPVTKSGVQTNRWYYCVATYVPSGANNWKLYMDGVKASEATLTGAVTASAVQNTYGGISGYTDRWFDGTIDEIRVSSMTRSSNWVWACWINQSTNHDSFVEYETPVQGNPIANLAPTGITNNQAVFNASLSAAGTEYTVYVHWGMSDGGTNIGSWTGTSPSPVGSWTNVSSTNISYVASGLSGDTLYWYTFRASNDTSNVWATPSWNFSTLPSTSYGSTFMFW